MGNCISISGLSAFYCVIYSAQGKGNMGTSAGIGKREREILTAIVETYISTGEPVGSRTLVRSNRENLSAASIRNVMADLADAGFLEQPHTSAGRVPTAQAYRFYVKQLTGETRLSPADESLIQGSLQSTQDLQEFLERSSHVLSLISHGVGVTVSSAARQRNALEHVYFQRMADKKVLAVVVTRNGLVRDRVLRLNHDLPIAIWKLRPHTSTRTSAAGRWNRCATRSPIASSRSAVNTTA